MRSIIGGLLVALVIGVSISWGQDSKGAEGESGIQPQGLPAAAASQAAGAQNSQGEAWRYRQHQGLWWYWLPSNKWVYWTDGRWVPYDAQSYAEFNASRGQRVYSNSGGGYQGNWGPVRYDRYGQRQYPYSRRSSGIQQLGPVPAPGGVRSLPGWGGER